MEFKDFDIEEVLSQLTEEEKIGLVSGKDMWHTFPVHRLGIPSMRFSDGPYGVRGTNFIKSVPTASTPSGSVLACCWNTELMYKLGRMMGDQAHAKGAHLLLGPTINMARSPLGGRSFESLGEDPILTGLLASAFSKGVKEKNIMICPKHIVCNEKEEHRPSQNVLLSERALREIYLLPFMMIQKYNDPESYMPAYNRLRGKHCSENKYLLQDIVQKEWGFKGCYVSDWFGTVSCADSINAGMHLEMPGPTNWRGKNLGLARFHETVSQHALDDAVRGVLFLVKQAARSGIPENAPERTHYDEETARLLLQASREAVVLLKNDGILPLKKEKVLVIGDSAKKINYAAGGACSVTPYKTVSLYDALVERLGEDNVGYSLGAANRKLLPSLALFAKDKSKVPIKYCVYNDPRTVTDRVPVSEVMVPSVGAMLLDYNPKSLRDPRQLFANFRVTINVPETANYTLSLKAAGKSRLYINGKECMVNELPHKLNTAMGMDAPEVFEEFHFEAGKDYDIEVEFHGVSTTFENLFGTLTCGMEKAVSPEQTIKEAADLAKDFEQVIVITGLNKDFETEGIDRETMDLPPHQDALVEAVLKANSNAVVILESGTPVTLPWVDKAKAIVHSGYLGEQLGNALCDVIFGDYNPSGKLSFSWPKRYEDCSSASCFDLDSDFSVTYTDDLYMGYRHHDLKKIEPLYAFGHGLSYTSFEFQNLRVDVHEDTIDVSVQVKNTGCYDGTTVVQVYVISKKSRVPCAVKSLKGFTKVYCHKDSTFTAKVSLNKKLACSFYNTYLSKWTLDKGEYEVAVGASSDKLGLFERFSIDRSENWTFL